MLASKKLKHTLPYSLFIYIHMLEFLLQLLFFAFQPAQLVALMLFIRTHYNHLTVSSQFIVSFAFILPFAQTRLLVLCMVIWFDKVTNILFRRCSTIKKLNEPLQT